CIYFISSAQTTEYSSTVHQEGRFVSAHVGDSVTLECFYEGEVIAKYYWYKQTLGEKPRLISSVYVSNKNVAFYDECKNNPRFTLDTDTGNNHLKISDLHISDSAAYYCASSFSVTFEFVQGVTVSVKGLGLDIPALVHQSASEIIQPGGSVTLNCTVHTGTCDGEHSVYWFKQSQESHPGLIYTHEGRNDQCERKDDTQTHTCVYNLPMKSLNLSHTGTYYCAVVSCGHILFGDGTRLDFEDVEDSTVFVYFLSGALAFTTILSVLLAALLYIIRRRTCCQCREARVRFSASSTTNAENFTNEDHLHYAALRVKKASRSRRKDDTESECVYSSVKL
uniref:Uncharacterized LOC115589191 n=1 Tax=Sparus aurata TaxID=8175 RepID=A0A671XXY9_SPAAU